MYITIPKRAKFCTISEAKGTQYISESERYIQQSGRGVGGEENKTRKECACVRLLLLNLHECMRCRRVGA